MSDRERTDAGTFAEEVSLEDVLAVFDQVPGPVITSSDVASAYDCSTEAARQKLTRLYDRGEVDRRKSGRTVVYWRVQDTDPKSDAESRADSAERASGVQADPSGSSPGSTHRRDTAAALDGWEYGRSDEGREASYTVAVHATEWLQDQPDAVRKADAPLDELADVDPLDRDPETLWTRVVRSAWQHAAEQGVVEQPSPRTYRWGGSGEGSDHADRDGEGDSSADDRGGGE